MRKVLLIIMALGLLMTVPKAFADHPLISEMGSVQRLAHDVELAAARLHRMAEDAAHHGDRREERALARLHDFENRARHFHDQVESFYRDPEHTEADFEALVRSFYRAAASMDDLHGNNYVSRTFRRVDISMARLMDFYGGVHIFENYRYNDYDDDHDDFDDDDFDDDYRYYRRGWWGFRR